jgi:glyoxylase-like metal-dependent hydrolase (beta-lactamase superfamily II)
MSRFSCVAIAASAVILALPSWPANPDAGPFRSEELAPGVHLFRPSLDGDAERVNSLVVQRSDGLLIVGAQPSPDAARELLAAIAVVDRRGVRYLALPHSHAEAAGGVSAFPETTLVIASRPFVEALADTQYDFEAERRAPAVAAPAQARPVPTLVLESRVLLADSLNDVELVPWDGRHSRGDLLVGLPKAGVLFAGAILFPRRDPWAGDAHLGRWTASLSHLIVEPRTWLVPLRGPAIAPGEVRAQRDALAWLRAEVANGLADGLTDDALHARILASPGLARHFVSDPGLIDTLVTRGIHEAQAEFRKHLGVVGKPAPD